MTDLTSDLGRESTLAGAADTMRLALNVERVSIARVDHDRSLFEILGAAGKPLLSRGLEVPLCTSSQIAHAAAGTIYCAPEFNNDPGWVRPVDGLMLELGFRSGCSAPVGTHERPAGVVSLSATRATLEYSRRIDALLEIGDVLERLLQMERPKPVAKPGLGATLICHDDEVISQGLARLIELEFNAETLCCTSIEQAVELVARYHIDIVLCDDYVDDTDVVALTAILRRAGTAAPVVVVSGTDSSHNQHVAASGGAAGYVVRSKGRADIVNTLSAVRQGRSALPLAPIANMLNTEGLTRRERDVLVDLDAGLRFKDIAVRHGISVYTAHGYAKSLFRKLGAHSRSEAVNIARHQGLLDSVRRHAHQAEG